MTSSDSTAGTGRGAEAWQLWQVVRQKRPLVQCITNYISMDIMANVLLAAGASPAMAASVEEVEDFVGIASALLVNLGSPLSTESIASRKLAAMKAVSLGKPWVLDPVGCGATPHRTRTCLELLRLRPTVVRGNASEIITLAGASGQIHGVDSTKQSTNALSSAMAVAKEYQCVVAISGKTDLITDGTQVLAVDNGVEMLSRITATGCSMTALITAFVATVPADRVLFATASAVSVFGLAGEVGYEWAQSTHDNDPSKVGPGSLRVGLMDQLYTLDQAVVEKRVKISNYTVS